ncbi:unnamed protein product [Coffea canephora]|uniref:Wound-responsive family protein n=1 Tax=Coffea canephora TaxID=49390 RepID=A0A068V2J1_COFCA|nr:unnamed protein product [Coffea canephora]
MSSTTRAWIAAVSVGTVQAMKDQGLYRWNHTIRSMQQLAKNNLRSLSQTKQLSPALASSSIKVKDQEKLRQSEESLRKVMYLSCWGPN